VTDVFRWSSGNLQGSRPSSRHLRARILVV
jgi:hypothetical protein